MSRSDHNIRVTTSEQDCSSSSHGGDGTDYRNTGTSSFLEHYSQRLSAACVMHGAAEGLKAINRAAKNRIARKRRSDVGV